MASDNNMPLFASIVIAVLAISAIAWLNWPRRTAASESASASMLPAPPPQPELKPAPEPLPVPFVALPVNVLFVQLTDDGPASVEDEWSALQALGPNVHAAFKFTRVQVRTATELARVLNRDGRTYNVLHLSGHAAPGGGMALGDRGGFLNPDALGRSIADFPIALVIFNACGTVQKLQQLIGRCSAAAIGTTSTVTAEQAVSFSESLYSRLATKNALGVYTTFIAALDASRVGLDETQSAVYVEAWPAAGQAKFERSAPLVFDVPMALAVDDNKAKALLYLEIVRRAATPTMFCTFTDIGKDALQTRQAWGIQYEFKSIWAAGALKDELAAFLEIPEYRRPMVTAGKTEIRQATYYLNLYRAVTGIRHGPALFAVLDGNVYYEDKGKFYPYRSSRDLIWTSQDPSPWNGFVSDKLQ